MATTTAALTMALFYSRVMQFIGRSRISQYSAASPTSFYRLEHVLEDVSRYAKYNEEDGIPTLYRETCYGIQWAINTGRLDGGTIIALKAMKVSELVRLIYKVQANCENIGQVPEYLISLNLQPAQ